MLNKYLVIILILFTGCIEENNTSLSPIEEVKSNSLLLREIEERGDFINSRSTSQFPSFINAEKLHNNLDEYIIIDVRDAQKFSSGHILGAVNISKENLFQYLISNSNSGNKIIIVSSSGQSAAYFTYLFRSYGLTNVYSLLFGMASWNKKFENEILNFTSNSGIGNDIVNHSPSLFFPLPDIDNSDNKNIVDIIENRIKELILDGFIEDIPLGSDNFSSINTINFSELNANISNYYITCYGTTDLYGDPKGGIAHPAGAVLYYPFYPNSDIQSTKNLQTFPPNKMIGIYSYSGYLSAMLTAHLRLLGYNAKSILFGGHAGYFIFMKNSISAGKYYAYLGAEDFPIIIE